MLTRLFHALRAHGQRVIIGTALTALAATLTPNAHAQPFNTERKFERIAVTPSLTAGFTFGATFNIGLQLDFTTSLTNDFDKVRRGGLSTGYYLVLSKGGFQPHQIAHIDLIYEHQNVDFRTGYAFIQYKWGRQGINQSGISGLSLDMSFKNRSNPANNDLPWFGLKGVFYNTREWTWFNDPYGSIYARQKFGPYR